MTDHLATAQRLSHQELGPAKLRNTIPVFLVGNIEDTMAWYRMLGFEPEYFPPGFCILRRDGVQIFIQQHDGYIRPDDPGAREREAWNVYIDTDDLTALFEEFSRVPNVTIARPPCAQPYGQSEFDILDLNGYRLVFAQALK